MTIKNYSKQCLMISAGIMVLALLLSLFGMGINVGIDFSGGMSMQYTMGEAVTQSDIEGVLNGIGLKDYAVSVQGTGKDSINIRIKAIDEDGVQGVQASITEALQAKYPNAAIYGDVNYVGPVAGATLLRNAFLSVLIAALCMLIYIAIRFDFNSGAAAVLGLVHDVLIMLSFMVILRSFVQMNSSFIAAMLTIVGYSINNTIIIFDRIRENARKMPSSTPRVDVVNRSIKECLGRTINTTLTTLVTIVCLYIFGVSSIASSPCPSSRHHLRRVQREHDQRLRLGVPRREEARQEGRQGVISPTLPSLDGAVSGCTVFCCGDFLSAQEKGLEKHRPPFQSPYSHVRDVSTMPHTPSRPS